MMFAQVLKCKNSRNEHEQLNMQYWLISLNNKNPLILSDKWYMVLMYPASIMKIISSEAKSNCKNSLTRMCKQ